MRAVDVLWTVAGLLLASGPATGPSGAIVPGPTPGSDHTIDARSALESRSVMPSDSGEFREGQYTDDHGTRRYRLYVPSGAPATGRPLVVMLHGCTQDPEDFAAGTRANARAESAGALVLYPEQPATAHPQKCWSWYDPVHQRRGGGEPALLAGMTRWVVEETGADPGRVFVAGISAGGSMAQILAAAYPELYRALAVHSAPAYRAAGDVPTALTILQEGVADPDRLPDRVLEAMGERARPVPALVLHGAVDPVVRAVNAEQVLRQWAGVAVRTGAADPAPATGAGGGDCPGITGLSVRRSRVEAVAPARRCVYRGAPVRIEYWLIEGMGHAWSGGSERGSYTDPTGPDATDRVFRFFLESRASDP